MATRSKYEIQAEKLFKLSAFSVNQARELGIPRHVLAYLAKKGVIETVAKGVYRSSHKESGLNLWLEDLLLANLSIPLSVVCLISALHYYQLTEEIPREHWLAIPHSKRAPRSSFLRAVRMRNVELGRTTIQLRELSLTIFDRERTIVDTFRYLSPEIAVKALQLYLKGAEYRPNLERLIDYSKQLRVNIRPYLISLTV